MSEWKENVLADIAELKKNSWKVGDEVLPYIGLQHIEENKLRLNSIGSSEEINSNKYRFKAGDTLFGKLRPYFRKVVKPDFDGICSTDIWVVHPKDGVDADFLFYFFANEELVNLSYASSSGTRMPRADWDFLKETKWPLPSPPEQEAIASVLSCLDEKIDLLHRQNQTLEAMAETLFRQWFVEEVDEGWEEEPLSDIAEFLNGKACQKYPPKNPVEKLPVLKIKELKNGITDSSDWASTEVGDDYIVENGDVIFSWSASLLVKIWDGERCILNQHLFKVTSERFPKWFYYLWSKYHLDRFQAIARAQATTMGHIRRKDLDEAMVLYTEEIIEEKDEIFAPIISKIVSNNQQIAKLEELRDALLPKLMSGKIRVK
ncbi:restriction endonuclease subunit S [Rhodohalobacter sulfatireducens]|uniref:Restriction endonuclease subunit S n=1 Tax=Rhodohalobacter sulfatireducens TaxID=2911366 RepID=A0ABS9KFB6_9BACT|nr:restriction endonuclease subunit S [Rhodohalobacter sulfatireducens]MCG2589523.1 restriction endonuclease subunit S [Rhodohalobacter sulfatireducens]